MEQELLVPIDFIYDYVFAALLFLGAVGSIIAQINRELSCRKAGPVRFRLGLASLAYPPKRLTEFVQAATMSRSGFIVAGLIYLACGAVLLAVGSGTIWRMNSPDPNSSRAFWLGFALFGVVSGLAALREAISGTRVRERGIEILAFPQPWSRIVPWSRIAVKDWQPCEGGFALHLILVAASGRRIEVIVPVPASKRPAVEEFLDERIATAA
jgi:hypothetical protein